MTFKDSYDKPSDPQFILDFIEVHRLAAKAQVGFSLTYVESERFWNITVTSCAPSECYDTNDWSLGSTMDLALVHLRSITNF